jgi:hypothetical protein
MSAPATSLDPSRRLDFYFRINRAGTKVFNFLDANGTALDVSGFGLQLNMYEYAGARNKTLSLTVGSGLTVSGTNNSRVTAAVTATNTNIKEGEYYIELYKGSTSKTYTAGKAFLHNGIFDGVSNDVASITVDDSGEVTISISDSDNHFLGKYTTLLLLQASHPTASIGDYATVEAGVGTDVVVYNWDSTNSAWVAGGGGSGALTNGNGTTANGTAVDLGGTVTADTTINTNGKYVFIGESNSGLHLNSTPYITGGYKHVLWSPTTTTNEGTAIGNGDLDGSGDGSYAGIFTGAGGPEVSMSAGSTDGQSVELYFQANAGSAFTCIFEDTRTVKKGIEYGVQNSADWSASTLVTKLYADARETAAKAYADTLVVGLLDDRGNYNPSTNSNLYPTTGGSGAAGALKKGDLFSIAGLGVGISVAIGGKTVTNGDVVRSLTDTPGQTDTNWVITENNFGYVAENSANKSGTISASATLYPTHNAVIAYAQPIDSDLTAIAAIAPSNDDIMQRKAGVWVNRTLAQLRADLGYIVSLFLGPSTALTNQALAKQPFGNSSGHAARFDATLFTQIRLSTAIFTSSASVNSPRLYPEYSTDNVTWITLGAGTVASGDAITMASTGPKTTNWITLPAGALANVMFRCAMEGGDAAADPVTCIITAEFK